MVDCFPWTCEMTTPRKIFSTVAIVALLVVIVWQSFLYVELRIRVSFADEQITVFADTADRAQIALSQDPPDVKAAVQLLEYVRDYYASGTKQPEGSALDRVVEQSRRLAMTRIMEMLRRVTGEDAGSEPEDWIRKFGGE